MTTTTHPLVDDYLRRLRQAARLLPRHQADELVDEIRGHLDEGVTPASTEADVRNLLDALGPPEAIVAEAGPSVPRPERGVREVLALVLLLTGLPLVIGWLVGAVLLLLSPLWTPRQKLLGLAVFPGGYFLTLPIMLLMAARTSTDTCAEADVVVQAPTSLGPTVTEGIGSGTAPVRVIPDRIIECGSSSGTSIGPTIVLAIIVIAPLLVTAYLYRAAGRQAAEA